MHDFGDLDTIVSAHSDDILRLSHAIADDPELGMSEHRAAARLATDLDRPGVRIERDLGGIDTAFRASAGSGPLRISLCAEYDALPEIGHGCGHNLIAAASYGAFLALAESAESLGLTVELVGTPGEENAGGKVLLADAGIFADTHAALMLHPGPHNFGSMSPLACTDLTVTFTGAAAHASYAPHLGRNALDALTVMLTAVGLARQQLEPGQQIHGVPASPFGAANVIPDASVSNWMVRAHDLDDLRRAVAVVERCARAGAVAADCEVQIEVNPIAYAHLEPDADLLAAYQRHAEHVGARGDDFEPRGGSTDMGNVSLAVPAIHPMLRLGDGALPIHTRTFAEAARSESGDALALTGARLLARVAAEAATTPELRARLLRGERRTTARSAA